MEIKQVRAEKLTNRIVGKIGLGHFMASWWLLNEEITPWFILGTVLILVGMYLCEKRAC